jgi:hypothetical protein
MSGNVSFTPESKSRERFDEITIFRSENIILSKTENA